MGQKRVPSARVSRVAGLGDVIAPLDEGTADGALGERPGLVELAALELGLEERQGVGDIGVGRALARRSKPLLPAGS